MDTDNKETEDQSASDKAATDKSTEQDYSHSSSVDAKVKLTNQKESNSKGVGNNDSTHSGKSGSKRPHSETVIEISDTESDDSSICAVSSYQASPTEVKRIRGADYSSSSSSTDSYSSDEDSPFEDDSVVVKPSRASYLSRGKALANARANRMDDPIFNPSLAKSDLMEQLQNHWKDRQDLKCGDVTFTCNPFRLCLLNNFLKNSEIINNIVDDMNTLDWNRKRMDLYEFHQTTDLANLSWQRSIRGIYELLKNDIKDWVSNVTGMTLTNTSASCSLYGPGDHLLVHDDLLGDRKVAFILYLAPWNLGQDKIENGSGDSQMDKENCTGWSESLGGALELLERNDKNEPTEVAKRIFPCNNMLAFFRVGPDSFHQVAEVTSWELPRLTINGWFHGPDDEEDGAPEIAQLEQPVPQPNHNEIVIISDWLSSAYMTPRTRIQIQRQIEHSSEISLGDFLLQDKYESVVEALKSQKDSWEVVGPANQRRYEVLPIDWIENKETEDPIRQFIKVISGTAFFRFLCDCTDLRLTGYCQLEIQKWRPGSHTVLPPKELYSRNQLDLSLYLGLPDRPICGGQTIYLAPDDTNSDPLVTLEPKNNSLNLVYSDTGTAKFTKYVSKLALKENECFYIISCTYKE